MYEDKSNLEVYKDTLSSIFDDSRISNYPSILCGIYERLWESYDVLFEDFVLWVKNAKEPHEEDKWFYYLFFEKTKALFLEGGEELSLEIDSNRREIAKFIFPYTSFLIYSDYDALFFHSSFYKLFDKEHGLKYLGAKFIYLATAFKAKKIIAQGFECGFFKFNDVIPALCIAITNEDKETFELLVSIIKKREFDLSKFNRNPNDFLHDPIWYAVTHSQPEMMKMLMFDLGIPLRKIPDEPVNILGNYLHYAVERDNRECVQLALLGGDSIHYKVCHKTPLDKARSKSLWDIVKVLYEADKDGTTNSARKDCAHHQGKKIDISQLNKKEIAVRLYINAKYLSHVLGGEAMELEEKLVENNYKLLSFNSTSLCLDLSGDELDPTEYDDKNKTYYNEKIKTAYQCIEDLKEELGLCNAAKEQATLVVQALLDRKDCKFNSYGWLYFYPEIPFPQLIEFANLFKQMGLSIALHSGTKSHLADFHTKIPHIAFIDEYNKIIEVINTFKLNGKNQVLRPEN